MCEWTIENQKRYFSGTKCLIELKFKFVCCVEHYLSFLNGCSLGFFNTCLKNGHTVALVRASPKQVTHTAAVGKTLLKGNFTHIHPSPIGIGIIISIGIGISISIGIVFHRR